MSGRITSSPWRLLAVTNISSVPTVPTHHLNFSLLLYIFFSDILGHINPFEHNYSFLQTIRLQRQTSYEYLSPAGLTGRAILFIFKGLFLPYIHGCFACMYMCTMCKQCLWRPEEGNGVPRTGTTNLSELSRGCKEPDRSPLPEQRVLLTAEQSLQLWLRNILQ